MFGRFILFLFSLFLFWWNTISATFDEIFRETSDLKDKLDKNMNQYMYSSNVFQNYDITQEEVRTAVHKSKMQAVGVQRLPNRTLKLPSLPLVLFSLFKFHFKYNIVCSTWYESIIKPISKSARNYPKIPLN